MKRRGDRRGERGEGDVVTWRVFHSFPKVCYFLQVALGVCSFVSMFEVGPRVWVARGKIVELEKEGKRIESVVNICTEK